MTTKSTPSTWDASSLARAARAEASTGDALPDATLPQLLNEFTADEHEKTADILDALLTRLGRDGLSTEEWNALIGAASFSRLEVWRRRNAARVKADAPLDMCAHGADRGSYCGYCGGYSKGAEA